MTAPEVVVAGEVGATLTAIGSAEPPGAPVGPICLPRGAGVADWCGV